MRIYPLSGRQVRALYNNQIRSPKDRQAGLRCRAQLSGAFSISAQQDFEGVHNLSARFFIDCCLSASLQTQHPANILVLLQPDSYRAPYPVGVDFGNTDKVLAQCGQGLSSGPRTAHATSAASLPPMSGYSKNQQYVYGKCAAAHLTSAGWQLPWFGRLVPTRPTCGISASLTDHTPSRCRSHKIESGPRLPRCCTA